MIAAHASPAAAAAAPVIVFPVHIISRFFCFHAPIRPFIVLPLIKPVIRHVLRNLSLSLQPSFTCSRFYPILPCVRFNRLSSILTFTEKHCRFPMSLVTQTGKGKECIFVRESSSSCRNDYYKKWSSSKSSWLFLMFHRSCCCRCRQCPCK